MYVGGGGHSRISDGSQGGKSAINLGICLEILPNLTPGYLFYVRPVGGLQIYLC